MPSHNAFAFLILIITAYISYKGLTNYAFLEKYSFKPKEILVYREFYRLITSGFLHGSWMHLAFNMVTLFCFAEPLEYYIGLSSLTLIYFISLIGGNLLALFIHRNKSDYSAVGASGAISGLVFACIALFPDIEVGLIFLPYKVPGWAFTLLYMAYTLYGIQAQNDNIGHEAHLGGGLAGLTFVIIKYPYILQFNLLPVAIIVLPTLVFLSMIIANPTLLMLNSFTWKRKPYTVEDKFNTRKREQEKELDLLLDKISREGVDRLSRKEKQRLEDLSK